MTAPAASNKQDCAAEHLATGWECKRCALAWDDIDRRPDCSPLTYARLAAAATAEAERIESSQAALTVGDELNPPIRRFRYQPQLQRAMELRALAELVEKYKALAKDKAA